jgi:hypothetical protein
MRRATQSARVQVICPASQAIACVIAHAAQGRLSTWDQWAEGSNAAQGHGASADRSSRHGREWRNLAGRSKGSLLPGCTRRLAPSAEVARSGDLGPSTATSLLTVRIESGWEKNDGFREQWASYGRTVRYPPAEGEKPAASARTGALAHADTFLCASERADAQSRSCLRPA